MPKLTDDQFKEIEHRLNCAIHELVFASSHAEENQLEEAVLCLTTAYFNINQVADELDVTLNGAPKPAAP